MSFTADRILIVSVVFGGFLSWFNVVSAVTRPEDAAEKLSAAHRMVRISEASREVIEEKLETLQSTEGESAEKVAEYENYLKRIKTFEQQQRKVLTAMQALYEPFAPEEDAATASRNKNDGTFGVSIPRDDASARLEREFKRSLESFDGELLKRLDELAEEMEELEEDAASESSELSAAIEAAQRRLEQADAQPQEGGGGGMEAESMEGAGSGEAGGPDQVQPAEQGTAGGGEENAESSGEGEEEQVAGYGNEQSTPTAGEAGRADLPEGSEGVPEDEPPMDSHDDDIISRQIREAAEMETDLELKAKLWAEYKRYRESSTH